VVKGAAGGEEEEEDGMGKKNLKRKGDVSFV
jgi:hypothetical protein